MAGEATGGEGEGPGKAEKARRRILLRMRRLRGLVELDRTASIPAHVLLHEAARLLAAFSDLASAGGREPGGRESGGLQVFEGEGGPG